MYFLVAANITSIFCNKVKLLKKVHILSESDIVDNMSIINCGYGAYPKVKTVYCLSKVMRKMTQITNQLNSH